MHPGKFVDGVSVVIVSLNGRTRLRPTLEHLARQQSPAFRHELLFVDNNSTDGTAEFVEATWREFGAPYVLRILTEPRPGQMYARHTGLREASYRYVLFCDDDNWLESDYLTISYDLIRADPRIAAVGGQGVPTYPQGIRVPEWVPSVVRFLGCGPQGPGDGDVTLTKGCLYTAGAILDRVWIEKLNESGFRPKLKGRDGHSLVGGEDTELTYALKAIGARLHYSSALAFRHYLPASRLQWEYVTRLFRAMGYSNYRLRGYVGATRPALLDAPSTLVQLVRCGVRALRHGAMEGDGEMLRLHRMLGQMQAILRLPAR